MSHEDTEPFAVRLRGLPRRRILGREFPVAVGFRVRLLGLSWLCPGEAGPGLLIPRCASVHTFGMRFGLDLVFLDRGGRPLDVVRGVPPSRLVWRRGARAVLELPSRREVRRDAAASRAACELGRSAGAGCGFGSGD